MNFLISVRYLTSTTKANHALLANLVGAITADAFKKEFFVLALDVSCFLEWLFKVDIPDANSIYKLIKKKADRHSKALDKLRFS